MKRSGITGKNINAQNAERYAKMTDAELSKKLGNYQKQARIWILVGLAGAIGGTGSYFAGQNTALKAVLTAVLFFGGVGCAVFLGGGAQKKIKQLMQSEMGDFFQSRIYKAVRRSYIKSLSEMKETLDILFKNNEMFSCE